MGSSRPNVHGSHGWHGKTIVKINVCTDMVRQRIKDVPWNASGPSILDKCRLRRTITPTIRGVQRTQTTSNETAAHDRLQYAQRHRVARERPGVAVISRPSRRGGGQTLQPHSHSRRQSHSPTEMPIALPTSASKAWAHLPRSPTPLGRGIAIQNKMCARYVDSCGSEAPAGAINIRCGHGCSDPWSAFM